MMAKWAIKKIGDIAQINPETYSLSEGWDFINYLDTSNITEGHIYNVQTITSRENLPSRARRKVKRGDMIYSTVRPNQRHYGLLSSPLKNMLVSTGFAVIRGEEGVSDTRYLYYYLSQDHIIEKLQGIAEHNTSAYPAIRPSDIANLEIKLPSWTEQQEVAATLGGLDDKVKLNRRMNETLEQMARAIFKDWFVDFGPVRAKMEGSEPYLSREIWDLFPDRLDEDGTPEGWNRKHISEIANIESGVRPRNKVGIPDETNVVPVYGGNGVSWFTDTVKYHPSFVVTGRVGTLGTVFIVNEKCWVSDNALMIKPFIEERVYYIFYSLERIDLKNLNSGSTQPLLTQRALRNQALAPCGEKVLREFCKIAGSLWERKRANDRENKSLEAMREFLHPKLMSGEIAVRDAERTVEGAL